MLGSGWHPRTSGTGDFVSSPYDLAEGGDDSRACSASVVRRVPKALRTRMNSIVHSDPGNLCSRGGRFLSDARRRLDAVNVLSILNSNQFQIVRRKDFPFRVLHFQSRGFAGVFVQNLKTFLSAGEEITFSPLAQSNEDRQQLSAFLG